MHLCTKRLRGPRFEATFRVAAVAFVVIMMAATLIPTNLQRASAADCPSGQVRNAQGECVSLLNLGDGSRVLDPDIIVPSTETPVLNDPPVINVDVTPTPTFTPKDQDPQIDVSDVPPLVDTTPEAGEPASLMIGKYQCPDGYDPAGKSQYDLSLDCATGMNGVTFLLSDGQSAFLQQTTGDVSDSAIELIGQIPTQPISIVEQTPDGFGTAVVFCGSQFENGPSPQYAQLTVDSPNQIFHIFQTGELFICQWFNIPGDGIPQATPVGDPAGDSTVYINKHGCPSGYDASAEDYYDLALNCHEDQNGITFIVSDGGSALQTEATGADIPNAVQFENLPAIPVSIVEQVPAGYGAPIVFCDGKTPEEGGQPTDFQKQSVLDGNQIFWTLGESEYLFCDWFNMPVEDSLNKVEVSKRACPVGFDAANANEYDLAFNCQTEQNGILYTLTDGASATYPQETGAVIPSGVSWETYAIGDISITEEIPAGYDAPVVYCTTYDLNGPNQLGKMAVQDGTVSFTVAQDQWGICNWYNVPSTDPGSITVYKYTCPEGYDVLAQGADPAADCPDTTNGINFVLDQPQGVDLQTQTGDSIDGAVYFGGLVPGNFTVTEQVPAGIAEVFVLDCTGNSAPLIQNYPLVTGNALTIDLLGGDEVVCRWYNVPEAQYGTIEIEKYYCEGEAFIDEDLCQIYEGGAKFAISSWDGNQWSQYAQGTTGANGYLTFADLPAGTYSFDELNGDWCYAVADRTDVGGNLLVEAGKTTEVTVYNCGVVEQVTKQPVKYPNTGVGQASSAAPAALFAPVSPLGGKTAALRPDQWAGVFDERLLLGQVKGVKPVQLKIDAIEVDAEIEVLEVVNGEMQDPTTADQASWYKDSGRLGASGNVIIAGHLNYWGVPEGVFFRLDQLGMNDVIELTGEDGKLYRYQVTWVKNYPSDEAPPKLVIGGTSKKVLTLITCGGEWNANAVEYNERTIVRAHLIEDEFQNVAP